MHPDFEILYEDEDFLAAAKLGPIPVQADASGDPSLQTLLAERLCARDGRMTFLEAAHRIDRRTSGVVLFGKSHRAVSALDAAFRARRVRKIYLAVPERRPEPRQARLAHRIVRDPRKNRTLALPCKGRPEPWQQEYGVPLPASGVAADLAVLDYRSVGASDRYELIEIIPLTGKTHQIRAQLAAVGCPLRGDLKYGARRSCSNGLVMLHAREVHFDHPLTGSRIDITAPFPDDESLWQAFSPLPLDEGAETGD